MDIRNNLARLLESHDCVIIPGFGGFIGSYAPARIDPVNHRFIPPSKKLLFNINLRQNDGLLISSIAAETGSSYEASRQMLEDFTNILIQQVKTGRGYTIPRIGRLFTDREGNIQFDQDQGANLLPDSFGLFTFVAPPVSRNTYSERLEKKVQAIRQNPVTLQPRFPVSLKWAAILAIPVSAAALFTLTQFKSFNTEPLSNAGMLSSVISRFSSSSLVEKKQAPAVGPETLLFQDEPIVEEIAEETLPVDPPYAIIIGAFRIEENAMKAAEEARVAGFENAGLFDRSPSGLYRVCMGTFNTLEEAEDAMITAQAGGYPGAWLLEK